MFINKIAFLVTISRGIKFGTAETLRDRKHLTSMSATKHAVALYSKRGFRVSDAHTDNEFEPMRADLMDAKVNLNVASNNEHVPEIERHIRTVKDRVRCMYNSVPFKKIPSRMIVEMVTSATFWLSMFPPTDGISKVISPRGIIHGLTVDYNKHCQLEFGSYAQVDEEHDNSMQTRTTGAISLRPTGNAQGGHYSMSLTTRRRLNRNHWTLLPMPQDVIDRVHTLACRSKASRNLQVTWHDGTPIKDVAYDECDDTNDEDYL